MSLLAQPLTWVALATAGALLALSGPSGESPEVRARLVTVARPVLRWVVVAFAVLLAVPGLSEDFRAALIAALLVVAGWFVTFLFQQEERAADQIDLMIAFRAEIWVFLSDLRRNSRTDYAAALRRELDADPGARPFFPQPGVPAVFDAHAGQIVRLPHETVEEVVQFYSLLVDIRQYALEMREPAFLSRPDAVRRSVYEVYVGNLHHLETLGQAAVDSLNRALGVEVTTPDPARSDRPAGASALSGQRP